MHGKLSMTKNINLKFFYKKNLRKIVSYSLQKIVNIGLSAISCLLYFNWLKHYFKKVLNFFFKIVLKEKFSHNFFHIFFLNFFNGQNIFVSFALSSVEFCFWNFIICSILSSIRTHFNQQKIKKIFIFNKIFLHITILNT